MSTRIIAASLAALVVLVSACGDSGDPNAIDTAETDDAASTKDKDTSTAVSAGDVDLFDDSVVHTIEVEFDPDDYDAMIETYSSTGEKESIEATVTIDGETYEQVGIRLKGNSSLRGLGGGGFGDGAAPGGGGAGGQSGASAETPEELPWLIELDEFVDQSHDGYEDIVIRANNSETSLNEAVALDLLGEAGLASQDAVATSFSVNGSDAVLRLAIEHPDDDAWYERAFDDAEGALYKAESTGDWSYRGDDPEAYDEVFDQEGGDDVADLTPLIDFLQFVDESDDATFAAELPERLDVEAFATYLAMMDLIGNTDDIDGPGNNAYLWWDAETEQFTVVPWDMNLAFGGFSVGGGGGPAGFQPPQGTDREEILEGFEPPQGLDPAAGGRGGFGGPGGRSNPLVERFLADEDFAALYEQAQVELRAALYDSGVADGIVDEWVATLSAGAASLVDEATIESEASAIRSSFS